MFIAKAGSGVRFFCTKLYNKKCLQYCICALKLAMPLSVLSAIREASTYNITVKGGKYLEAMAEADTI
ncbi:MAG: hypothetical protein SPL23_09100, partial [Lachnospiraceae bacterium]|nr:hypothetical protein [Lachnospiraceae bacterium]